MLPDPVPLAGLMRSPESIEQHRNVFCNYYMRCLDYSMRQGWTSFSCSRCALKGDGAQVSSRDFANDRRRDPMAP